MPTSVVLVGESQYTEVFLSQFVIQKPSGVQIGPQSHSYIIEASL